MSRRDCVIVFAGVAIVIGVLDTIVGPPIARSTGYRAMVSEYARAIPAHPTIHQRQPLKWSFEHRVAGGTTVRVHARSHMDVVKVHYPDEAAPRTLYDYEEYSNPVAIRIAGNKLFVHWAESLFHIDHWLLAYDIENRREVERRRVDPRDMLALN
jgi:hypothetical protein